VVGRYRDRTKRRFFRGDAAFALPDLYDYLEAEGYKYTIRLKANSVLQGHIAHLLKRPVGRPPKYVQRFYASFSYQAGSWSRKRRVVAKVEWHPGELYPRVGFSVEPNDAKGRTRKEQSATWHRSPTARGCPQWSGDHPPALARHGDRPFPGPPKFSTIVHLSTSAQETSGYSI